MQTNGILSAPILIPPCVYSGGCIYGGDGGESVVVVVVLVVVMLGL